MPRGILVTMTECADPQREEEWNRWYSHTHIPDLSRAQGFVRARRFRRIEPETAHNYHVLYEFESPDLVASYNDFLGQALRSYRAGRVIDCNRSWHGGAESTSTRGLWEEIEPDSLRPLERVAYPTTGREATFGPIEARLRAAGLLI